MNHPRSVVPDMLEEAMHQRNLPQGAPLGERRAESGDGYLESGCIAAVGATARLR
jgi:hypothetical protein